MTGGRRPTLRRLAPAAPGPRATGVLAGIVVVSVAVWSAPASAASFDLTKREQAEAIGFGEASVIRDSIGDEWTVTAGGADVTVATPFYRLAALARQAAFQQVPLKPRDVEAIVRDGRERLRVWVSLRGDRPDFARFLTPALEAGSQQVRATFAQNERTALRQADGRFQARCLYAFPVRGLNPRGKIALVVREVGGAEVARVAIDLAGVR